MADNGSVWVARVLTVVVATALVTLAFVGGYNGMNWVLNDIDRSLGSVIDDVEPNTLEQLIYVDDVLVVPVPVDATIEVPGGGAMYNPSLLAESPNRPYPVTVWMPVVQPEVTVLVFTYNLGVEVGDLESERTQLAAEATAFSSGLGPTTVSEPCEVQGDIAWCIEFDLKFGGHGRITGVRHGTYAVHIETFSEVPGASLLAHDRVLNGLIWTS